MQTNSGLHGGLQIPFLYNLFQDIIGGNALRRKFLQNHVRAKAGDKVIDIGCGPAQILPWLPPVDYLGLDLSALYIAAAQRSHGEKGTFVVGDTRTLWDDPRFRDADIAIGLGILHHLDDDDAQHCFRFAHRTLKKGGRFFCLDACWITNQGPLSKLVMSMDRGQNVRTEEAYVALARATFENVNALVERRPMRIPYVTLVMECQK